VFDFEGAVCRLTNERICVSNVVIVSSVHDYRMARRGSVQAIADAFVRAGCETSFASVRFSPLSLLKGDPRRFLFGRANALEMCDSIACYLWATPFHPFRTGASWADWAMAPLHDIYAALPSADLDRILREADVVIVESGLGIVLIPRIRRLNPEAMIIYRASDSLDTIGAHPCLQRRLEACADEVDHFCLLAAAMAPKFAFAAERAFVVPQGIQAEDFASIGASPYTSGRNGVCVGSMLFDAEYFVHAAAAFPNVMFHVIGPRAPVAAADNVIVYKEMPFAETLPFVAHADFGIAPYRPAPGVEYLSESSLKLTQFAYLRKPAVCPHFAVGQHPHRFGYTPGDAQQIHAATAAALACRFEDFDRRPLTWDQIVPRLLRPRDFPETTIAEYA
jgi:2-beta-glucuronyltransferase